MIQKAGASVVAERAAAHAPELKPSLLRLSAPARLALAATLALLGWGAVVLALT